MIKITQSFLSIFVSKRERISAKHLCPAALELEASDVRNCRVVESREALLGFLPQGRVVAELGVALGHFSEKILRIVQPSHFYAIDLYGLHQYPVLWGKPSSEFFQGKTHEEFYADKFKVEIAEGVVSVRNGVSWDMLAQFPDSSLDIIYIDAAHDYESVKRDAMVACRKIKSNGVLIFNDYIMYDHIGNVPCGVVRVVNELCRSEGFEMRYFALQPNMFCDVALCKKS